MTAYTDNQGRVLFVHDGINRLDWVNKADRWATYYRMAPGYLRQIQEVRLPFRNTRSRAQIDLDRYASRNGYPKFEGGVCRVCGCTEHDACHGGFFWVEDPEDIGDLCSECLPVIERRMHIQQSERVKAGGPS